MIDVSLLASAVLKQVWRDARFASQPAVRKGASAWLLSPRNPDRQFWTAATGVEVQTVVETARRALVHP